MNLALQGDALRNLDTPGKGNVDTAWRKCGYCRRIHSPDMIQHFTDPTLVMFGKLLLAALLGVAMGTERALWAKQTAGTRTFGLVALGACLFVLAGIQIQTEFIGTVNFDPSRVLASVVQ